MKIFKDIPDDIWDEGAECKVWLGDDGYVYKAYKKIRLIDDLKKRLEALNSLPEYETEELYGYIPEKNIYVTRQKKLKDWEQIFVQFYISHNRRSKDWPAIFEQFMIDHGYEKFKRGWKKNGVIIGGIEPANIAMTDEDEIKIIDANLMPNGMWVSQGSA